VNGGAIVFNSYSPLIQNIVYYNNTAEFGSNIANYPTRIKELINENELVNLIKLSNIPSGEKIETPIILAIVDVEQDDIFTSNSKASISIEPLDAKSKIEGQSTIRLFKGIGSFTESIFQASPGRTGVRYLMTSSAINYEMLQYLDKNTYTQQIFTVDFRWCKPGEIQIGDI